MPWRAPVGQLPDPYHEWLSEIMLQQTTVTAVTPYFLKFIKKWPNVHALAKASSEDVMKEWAGLGYYARARNLHACAKIISSERKGIFPSTMAELKSLPGIGEYTASAIMAIAFNKPATVVDGNVERVLVRYLAIQKPIPDIKNELRERARPFFESEHKRPGDLAQAFMELGATICVPSNPRCAECPISKSCNAFTSGLTNQIPVAKAKKRRQTRYGYVYWIEDKKGRILIHNRPAKGLLGGMMALPTTEWVPKKKSLQPLPFINSIKKQKPIIKHVFSHFDLTLNCATAEVRDKIPKEYAWVKIDHVAQAGFPTVFKKAYEALK